MQTTLFFEIPSFMQGIYRETNTLNAEGKKALRKAAYLDKLNSMFKSNAEMPKVLLERFCPDVNKENMPIFAKALADKANSVLRSRDWQTLFEYILDLSHEAPESLSFDQIQFNTTEFDPWSKMTAFCLGFALRWTADELCEWLVKVCDNDGFAYNCSEDLIFLFNSYYNEYNWDNKAPDITAEQINELLCYCRANTEVRQQNDAGTAFQEQIIAKATVTSPNASLLKPKVEHWINKYDNSKSKECLPVDMFRNEWLEKQIGSLDLPGKTALICYRQLLEFYIGLSSERKFRGFEDFIAQLKKAVSGSILPSILDNKAIEDTALDAYYYTYAWSDKALSWYRENANELGDSVWRTFYSVKKSEVKEKLFGNPLSSIIEGESGVSKTDILILLYHCIKKYYSYKDDADDSTDICRGYCSAAEDILSKSFLPKLNISNELEYQLLLNLYATGTKFSVKDVLDNLSLGSYVITTPEATKWVTYLRKIGRARVRDDLPDGAADLICELFPIRFLENNNNNNRPGTIFEQRWIKRVIDRFSNQYWEAIANNQNFADSFENIPIIAAYMNRINNQNIRLRFENGCVFDDVTGEQLELDFQYPNEACLTEPIFQGQLHYSMLLLAREYLNQNAARHRGELDELAADVVDSIARRMAVKAYFTAVKCSIEMVLDDGYKGTICRQVIDNSSQLLTFNRNNI